jgi:hypothetical protein
MNHPPRLHKASKDTTPPAPEPRCENKYGVTTRGENLFIMHPRAGQALSVDDARNLAAWLCVVGDITPEELAEARELVEKEVE